MAQRLVRSEIRALTVKKGQRLSYHHDGREYVLSVASVQVEPRLGASGCYEPFALIRLVRPKGFEKILPEDLTIVGSTSDTVTRVLYK